MLVTNYTVVPPSQVYNVPLDCEKLATSIQTTSVQTTSVRRYKIYCGVDFGNALPSTQSDSIGSPLLYTNLARVIAYSLNDCLEACSWLNFFATEYWGCHSVYYSSRLHDSLAFGSIGNCWLKNGTPADIASFEVNPDHYFLGAVEQE